MLIRFVVENYLSFRAETEFNMLPAEIEAHPDHLHATGQLTLLPISVLYGANASGKSNLIKAMEAAQELVIKGPDGPDAVIYQDPFLMDEVYENRPSRFEFEFVSAEATYYSYCVVFDSTQILHEHLYRIDSEENPHCVFERKLSEFRFGDEFSEEHRRILGYESEGTASNATFIAECFRRRKKYFKDVIDWFNHLLIVFPNSRPKYLETRMSEEEPFKAYVRSLLRRADLGIEDLSLDDVGVSEEQRDLLGDVFRKNPGAHILSSMDGERVSWSYSEGQITGHRVVTVHRGLQGHKKMAFNSNSDGTKRLFELTPAFYDVARGGVVVVDELDRSMHPLLCRSLIETFLKADPSKRGQLIFSTHNTDLLDETLLRPDEVWLVEKKRYGSTTLHPLTDFKTLPKNWRKSYLDGFLGGTPILAPPEAHDEG